MAVKLNRAALAQARGLVRAGKINMEGAWSFDSSDRQALLDAVDEDWAAYGKWFLGHDSEAAEDTFERYKYPYGKQGKIWRRAVIAIKSRAAQQGETAIADAASTLLEAIDASEEEALRAEPERRFMPITCMQVRETPLGQLVIEGRPIVYEVYAAMGMWREIIRRGAATEALKTADELVLWDHESGQPMARRSAGTLHVAEDEQGVRISADVSQTVWGRSGYEAIKNRVITQMSFAFDVFGDGDRWQLDELEGGVKVYTREILRFAHLYDYSPVSYPAYTQTTVEAKAAELAQRHRLLYLRQAGIPDDDPTPEALEGAPAEGAITPQLQAWLHADRRLRETERGF